MGNNISELAEKNQQRAWQVLEESHVINAWTSIGATVNLVGSLKSGLLIKNLDIDLHVYTDHLTIADSFLAMCRIAENPAVKKLDYLNQLDEKDECLKWTMWYEDKENTMWKFDIVHIRKGSAYDGYIEKVTDSIIRALTTETKQTILQIKLDCPTTENITGIEIYRAVLDGGVKTYKEFVNWRKENPVNGVLEWMP